jgi:malate dehydrogenase (oxaloacetate-decarboxylating)
MNAARVVGKKYEDLTVVISGAGAAGLAIAQMLLGVEREYNSQILNSLPADVTHQALQAGQILKLTDGTRVKDVIILDSKGIITQESGGLKAQFAKITNDSGKRGGLVEALIGADAFIGVSKGGIMTAAMVASMAKDAIVLGMANPDPEILPEAAEAAGAKVVGTGRSDYPNQVNNSLVFPGLFKGLLESKATKMSTGIKQAARDALANFIEPTVDKILPSMFDAGQAESIAQAVMEQVKKEELVRK